MEQALKEKSQFSWSAWKHRSTPDRRSFCLQCEQKHHVCDVCQLTKAKNEFSATVWHDKAKPGQRTLCKECSHPACTSKHCKTCRTCRNPTCKKTSKRSHCTDEIQVLNAKQLPKTLEEVQKFLCTNCKFITCTRIDSFGVRCGKEMPKKAQARLPQNPRQQYICGTCQTLDVAKASLGKR